MKEDWLKESWLKGVKRTGGTLPQNLPDYWGGTIPLNWPLLASKSREYRLGFSDTPLALKCGGFLGCPKLQGVFIPWPVSLHLRITYTLW